MLTFPFNTDAKFTLIPKVGDETIPQSEMVDLTIKIESKNRGVSFVPIWEWNDVGIEIEIQRENIKFATAYSVVLDWRKPDAAYSDGFKDILNACVQIMFSSSCSVITDKTAIIEMGLNYSVINIVEELPETGNPGEFYAVIEDAG